MFLVKKMKKDEETINKIKAVIEKIRPFIINDGGNLEFVKYEDGTVYVKLLGACADCAMADVTLKDGIEEIIVNEVAEVERVEKVN